MVTYEWDLETFDAESGDILDHYFGERLRDVPFPACKTERLVLVRTTGDQVQGIVDRQWAYVDDSFMLPKHFSIPGPDKEYETDIKVPVRFHREIAREMS